MSSSELQANICSTTFGQSYIEQEQAELDQLVGQRIALTEGPDSQWPAQVTTATADACGAGSPLFLLMTMIGFNGLRRARPTIR